MNKKVISDYNKYPLPANFFRQEFLGTIYHDLMTYTTKINSNVSGSIEFHLEFKSCDELKTFCSGDNIKYTLDMEDNSNGIDVGDITAYYHYPISKYENDCSEDSKTKLGKIRINVERFNLAGN